jgi:hypothetical protein
MISYLKDPTTSPKTVRSDKTLLAK